ncbi:MAG: hypothetical protein ACYDG0_02635 [Vulcanimicrobiaceae bacterium]
MSARSKLVAIFAVSAIVGAYDTYAAIHGHGHRPIAWGLGALMIVIALLSLRKLIRRDYTNSWW